MRNLNLKNVWKKRDGLLQMCNTFIIYGDNMKKETTFSEALGAANRYEQEHKETLLWETAWKKAAASGKIDWPQEIISNKGTHKIEIMQSEADENKGMIVITVLKDKNLFEGKTILITDESGNKLLENKIQNAHAFNPNLNLKNIGLKLLVNTLD